MKYLIASDIHGSAYWTERLCAAIESEQPDRIVLLGDLLYHGPRNDLPRDYAPKRVIPLLNALADRIIAVRGNCDAEVDQMVLDFPVMADYATLFDETGRELFLTHGAFARMAMCLAPACTTASTTRPRCPRAPRSSTATRTSRSTRKAPRTRACGSSTPAA